MVKLSGADFRAFLSSKDESIWPPGLYIEEELLRIDGRESEIPADHEYNDDSVVEIISGNLAWENNQERLTTTLAALARRWLRKQNETRVVVTVPTDQLSKLADILKTIGAQVAK